MPAIDPDAPAALIWLPEGIAPTDADFPADQSWTLEDAAKQAYEAAKDHTKAPWIKSGNRVLAKAQIDQVISALRAMGMLHADRT